MHWSDPYTLEPVWEIEKADGKGTTSRISIARAKDLQLLPRSTGIIEDMLGASYQLQQYFKKTCILTAEEWRRGDGESDEEYVERISTEAAAEARQARDRGKEVHNDVYEFLTTGMAPLDPAAVEICKDLRDFLERIDAKGISCEKTLGGQSKGYTGTPDIYVEDCDLVAVMEECGQTCEYLEAWRGALVIDIKTAKLRKFKKPYKSWKYQFGAYGNLIGLGKDSLYVSWVADPFYATSKQFCYQDVDRWIKAFQGIWSAWKEEHDYEPAC